MDRLRARCSRAEYCCGQIAATLKRWKYEAAPVDGKSESDSEIAGERVVEERGTLAERTEADIAHIIATLVEEKFVDDERFANAFVHDKLKFNGWGRQKIVYKLKSLGVAQHIIDSALAENYYAADQREIAEGDNTGVVGGGRESRGVYGDDENLSGFKVLERLLERKWRSLKKEEPLQNKKTKAIRFALSRGFDYEDAMKIVRKLAALD